MKNVREILDDIPNFTQKDLLDFQTINDPHVFEVDGSNLVKKIVEVLRFLLGEFVNKEILHPSKSFEMNDQTTCLFKSVTDNLKKIIESPEEIQNYDHLLTKYSVAILMIFLGRFE